MENEARVGRPVRGSRTARPIMVVLDLLGRRGALRVIWELRATDGLTFRALAEASALPPATLNVRLRELREAGIVLVDGGYRLSPQGQTLLAALAPLTEWAQSWGGESGRG